MNVHEDKLVSGLSEIVAKECGICPAVARRIRVAAALHDIGKQKIPDSIIGKPSKLSRDEFELMKTHTIHGSEMLSSVQGKLGVMARTVCLYHHEWYDGSGSYWGKRSSELPFYVSIVSICDVFCALVSVRAYKSAWPPEEAIEYIFSKSGAQFSAELVEAFIRLVRHDESVKALFSTCH